ncbi:MAG: FlgD immunoglobulin-like domain containing protein [bacterium]
MFSNILNNKFALLNFFTLLWLNTLYAQTPVDIVSLYRITLNIDGNYLKSPYYSNYSLGDNNNDVNRAVVVIHGTNRNADDYYERILNPAKNANGADKTTIIIAPQFLIEIDIEAHNLPNNILFWSSGGWKRGDRSLNTNKNPRPVRISSFAVIDTILHRLAMRNPNLQTIVVAGHSAGGQFVNRFAAGSQMEQTLSAQFGIQFRYIVANPSSYLYFNEERRVEGTVDQFAVPTATGCQWTYDEYKYGLDNLNSYMSNVGVTQIRTQYQQREIVYLLGEDDNNPNHSSLDKSCPAMLQGMHRLERGIIYYKYLAYYFGAQIHNQQYQAIIPNVGHSSSDIFASDCGMYFLFDYGSCNSVTFVEDSKIINIPKKFILNQNYPNPFNPITTIEFNLPTALPVYLRIYDVTGKLVKSLSQGQIWNAGFHSVSWDGTNENGSKVGSGIYFYRINTQKHQESKRMILLE